MDGVSGALASAASRSAGWLAPVGAFGRWSKTLRESGGAYGTASSGPVALVDPRWTDQNGGDGSYVAAGDVVLPSPPADHPARRNRRPSAHAPIRGAASHYARKDDTVRLAADELEDRRLAERALAELELAEDENDENVDENEDGDDARGNHANAPKGGGGGKDGARAGGVAARGFERRLRAARSSSPSSKGGGGGADYFERVHMERAQRARALEAEKLARLNRHDGSRWTNRSTAPHAPKLGPANPRNASARERRQKSRAAEANRFAVLDRNMTDLDARFSISNRTRAGELSANDESGGKGGRRGSGFGAFFGASGARGYFAALARGGAGAPGGGLSSGDDSDRGGDETDLADDFASAGEDLDQEEAERAEETTGRAGGTEADAAGERRGGALGRRRRRRLGRVFPRARQRRGGAVPGAEEAQGRVRGAEEGGGTGGRVLLTGGVRVSFVSTGTYKYRVLVSRSSLLI